MNINNGIINATGISLGNLELASEYLYGDSTLYEPELSEIKQDNNVKEPSIKNVSVASDKILAKFEVELEHAILDTVDHGMDNRYDNDIWRETNDKSEINITDIKHVRKIRENDINIKNDTGVTGQHKSKTMSDTNGDWVDTAIRRCKKNESRDSNKAVKYDELEIDVLAEYVRKFLIQHGVQHGAVDMGVVIQEFGASNINKLLKKCYIIRIGKGVTIGI